ncbi:MAG: fenitrothion hydrolase [Acidimicrobiia bacterium]
MRFRRLLLGVGLAVGVVVGGAVPALAHGLGGRLDLPVPLTVFVVAAGVVLVLTFAGLAILWPSPRLQEIEPQSEGRSIPWLWNTLGGIGAFLLALTLVAAAIGIDNSTRNPAAVIVFVGFWLILPFTAALFVDLHPAISPWRRLPGWLGLRPAERPEMLHRLGYWPATVIFLLFTWLELVAPDNGPRSLGIAALIFTVYMVGMSVWIGTDTATQTSDGFAVYARFFGAMAPFTFDHGVWRRRGWLKGLVALPERTGMAAFVVAMIGTVTYDGGASTEWWITTIRDPLVASFEGWGLSVRVADVVAGTIGWAGVTLLVGLTYYTASAAAARLGGVTTGARHVASRFAHTLVPIGFAYAFAHYFTLILFEGQLFFSTFSDPFGLGWDLFGTADRRLDFTLIQESRAWVWYLQVGVIVLGHIAGVVLSHDRALVDFPRAKAVASQYAMLVLMMILTGLGLVILAAG